MTKVEGIESVMIDIKDTWCQTTKLSTSSLSCSDIDRQEEQEDVTEFHNNEAFSDWSSETGDVDSIDDNESVASVGKNPSKSGSCSEDDQMDSHSCTNDSKAGECQHRRHYSHGDIVVTGNDAPVSVKGSFSRNRHSFPTRLKRSPVPEETTGQTQSAARPRRRGSYVSATSKIEDSTNERASSSEHDDDADVVIANERVNVEEEERMLRRLMEQFMDEEAQLRPDIDPQLLRILREMLLPGNGPLLHELEPPAPEVLPFPVGRWRHADCVVCAEAHELHERICCRAPICDECLSRHCEQSMADGRVRIPCPSDDCDKFLLRDEINFRLNTEDLKRKYYQWLVNANERPNEKTCPYCNEVMHIEESSASRTTQVKCRACLLQWCFRCHASWHEGISCKKFKEEDVVLKDWAKQTIHNQLNARRCPRCAVYIQRNQGCDHMTCSRCHCEFCYRCGGRYRSLKGFGGHRSKYSVFGCKHLLFPQNAARRKFIRGSMFVGKCLAAPVALAGAVALGGLAIAFSPFLITGYCIYKCRK